MAIEGNLRKYQTGEMWYRKLKGYYPNEKENIYPLLGVIY